MTKSFDVFLSHNSKDKPAVRELAEALRARGLKVWLDEWELVPGRPWQEALEEVVETTRSSAVLVGKDGLGPWQDAEMRSCLTEFVASNLPVIPVLLPDAPSEPRLPLFLRRFTWVDLRGGLTEEGLDRLQWGVTGNRPDRSKLPVLPTVPPEVAVAAAEAQPASAAPPERARNKVGLPTELSQKGWVRLGHEDKAYVFISYSHVDKNHAAELARRLERARIQYFLDIEESIALGTRLDTIVRESLDNASHMVVLISPAMAQSAWVPYEMGYARAKEIIVIPYLLHGDMSVPAFIANHRYVREEDIDALINMLKGYRRTVSSG